MTEAVLIEIAQRRRRLEDAIEVADKTLARAEANHERECRNYSQSESMHAKQQFEKHSLESIGIQENRWAIEKAAEACRDDMTAMTDYIRKVRE